ncbi:MAG: 50S ribosomal protein L11 methyltransferase, partial [Anaerolineales bacterium]
MRKRKLFSILNHAIIDKTFRESLFGSGRQAVDGWNLTKEERSFLKRLPYEKFEQTVGGIFSHWMVPVSINNRYLIIPQSADDVQPNGHIPIRLTESLVFGNGTHATTALMLSALDDHIRPNMHVLDLGTGSGILSIAAALQGVGSVLAVDIDPNSVETASTNIHLTAVEKVVS